MWHREVGVNAGFSTPAHFLRLTQGEWGDILSLMVLSQRGKGFCSHPLAPVGLGDGGTPSFDKAQDRPKPPAGGTHPSCILSMEAGQADSLLVQRP